MTMSDRKRAETYLAASGAVPISVTRCDGVCTIHAGRAGAHGDVVVSTQWISEAQAIAVTREARRFAGTVRTDQRPRTRSPARRHRRRQR